MIKKYSWENREFGMKVEMCIDYDVFTEQKAKEHIEFFYNFNKDDGEPVFYALRSHAKQCLCLAIYESLNIHGVINYMNEQEGYFPVDGSEGILLTDIEGLMIDLCDDYNFGFEEKILNKMPKYESQRYFFE